MKDFDIEEYKIINTPYGLFFGSSPVENQLRYCRPPDSFDAAHPEEWWYERYDGENWKYEITNKVTEQEYKEQQYSIDKTILEYKLELYKKFRERGYR